MAACWGWRPHTSVCWQLTQGHTARAHHPPSPPPQVTGWNDDDLDTNTTDTYKPMIVVTPTRAGVDAVLYHTPPISNETLLADFDRSIVDKVYWKRRVPWADVVKQQGSVERVVPVREA